MCVCACYTKSKHASLYTTKTCFKKHNNSDTNPEKHVIYHGRYIIFTHLCDVILEILSNRSETRISERVVKLGHSVALIFTVQFELLQLTNILVCRSTAFLFVLWTIFLSLFTNLCSVGVGVSPQCVLSGINGIQSSGEYPSTSYSDMKYTPFGTFCVGNVDGSVHDCSNSIANWS